MASLLAALDLLNDATGEYYYLRVHADGIATLHCKTDGDVILHHYDISTVAARARTVRALKGFMEAEVASRDS